MVYAAQSAQTLQKVDPAQTVRAIRTVCMITAKWVVQSANPFS